MLKLKYVPVENCEAEWGDKSAVIKLSDLHKLLENHNLLKEAHLL